MQCNGFQRVSGTNEAAHGAVDKTVIAAVADKKIYVKSGMVMVTVASSGGAGRVALEDGLDGTPIFEASAAAVGTFHFNFGHPGYPLTADTLLNLTVDGATTQATARATVIGEAR